MSNPLLIVLLVVVIFFVIYFIVKRNRTDGYDYESPIKIKSLSFPVYKGPELNRNCKEYRLPAPRSPFHIKSFSYPEYKMPAEYDFSKCGGDGFDFAEGYSFDNSDYQYFPPTLPYEKEYFECVKKECGGSDEDQQCLYRCYVKSHRKAMENQDIPGLVCARWWTDPERYNNCLTWAYSHI